MTQLTLQFSPICMAAYSLILFLNLEHILFKLLATSSKSAVVNSFPLQFLGCCYSNRLSTSNYWFEHILSATLFKLSISPSMLSNFLSIRMKSFCAIFCSFSPEMTSFKSLIMALNSSICLSLCIFSSFVLSYYFRISLFSSFKPMCSFIVT